MADYSEQTYVLYAENQNADDSEKSEGEHEDQLEYQDYYQIVSSPGFAVECPVELLPPIDAELHTLLDKFVTVFPYQFLEALHTNEGQDLIKDCFWYYYSMSYGEEIRQAKKSIPQNALDVFNYEVQREKLGKEDIEKRRRQFKSSESGGLSAPLSRASSIARLNDNSGYELMQMVKTRNDRMLQREEQRVQDRKERRKTNSMVGGRYIKFRSKSPTEKLPRLYPRPNTTNTLNTSHTAFRTFTPHNSTFITSFPHSGANSPGQSPLSSPFDPVPSASPTFIRSPIPVASSTPALNSSQNPFISSQPFSFYDGDNDNLIDHDYKLEEEAEKQRFLLLDETILPTPNRTSTDAMFDRMALRFVKLFYDGPDSFRNSYLSEFVEVITTVIVNCFVNIFINKRFDSQFEQSVYNLFMQLFCGFKPSWPFCCPRAVINKKHKSYKKTRTYLTDSNDKEYTPVSGTTTKYPSFAVSRSNSRGQSRLQSLAPTRVNSRFSTPLNSARRKVAASPFMKKYNLTPEPELTIYQQRLLQHDEDETAALETREYNTYVPQILEHIESQSKSFDMGTLIESSRGDRHLSVADPFLASTSVRSSHAPPSTPSKRAKSSQRNRTVSVSGKESVFSEVSAFPSNHLDVTDISLSGTALSIPPLTPTTIRTVSQASQHRSRSSTVISHSFPVPRPDSQNFAHQTGTSKHASGTLSTRTQSQLSPPVKAKPKIVHRPPKPDPHANLGVCDSCGRALTKHTQFGSDTTSAIVFRYMELKNIIPQPKLAQSIGYSMAIPVCECSRTQKQPTIRQQAGVIVRQSVDMIDQHRKAMEKAMYINPYDTPFSVKEKRALAPGGRMNPLGRLKSPILQNRKFVQKTLDSLIRPDLVAQKKGTNGNIVTPVGLPHRIEMRKGLREAERMRKERKGLLMSGQIQQLEEFSRS
ncbi:hypothetical protein BLNAU_17365 [Blattamonas nauphoetae]|uniref:Uncharacterized protein n=1 Tax=Blattamonas nauphoetae TaxID=2049346 RepID=A0ABQ9XBW4_9EUKA|nr:hypothetical protein BLNAU_17365 [Blattamonas nauphoetae]